jgi:hypothetical protein
VAGSNACSHEVDQSGRVHLRDPFEYFLDAARCAGGRRVSSLGQGLANVPGSVGLVLAGDCCLQYSEGVNVEVFRKDSGHLSVVMYRSLIGPSPSFRVSLQPRRGLTGQ